MTKREVEMVARYVCALAEFCSWVFMNREFNKGVIEKNDFDIVRIKNDIFISRTGRESLLCL